MSRLDLSAIPEPKDDFGKLVILWLKNMAEANHTNQERLRIIEEAVSGILKVVREAQPDHAAAIDEISERYAEVHARADEQSRQSLDRVEEIAVLIRKLSSQDG